MEKKPQEVLFVAQGREKKKKKERANLERQMTIKSDTSNSQSINVIDSTVHPHNTLNVYNL